MLWTCKLFFQRISLNIRFPILFVFLLSINNTQLFANDIVEFNVTEEEGIYNIKASVILKAPADYVRAVLTDYVHIYRLNPSIIESEVLVYSGDDVARVRTKVIGCVISFCQEIERVDDVRMLASGNLQAEIVPELSQFKSGIAQWNIQPMGENSRLTYLAEMEPDFFIPPIIGISIVKDKIQEEMMTSFSRLEKIASIQSERDWDHDRVLSNRVEKNKTRYQKIISVDR